MKKLLYIILDGLGDRPIEALGNKTPLEAASTAQMDRLANTAKLGCVYTVEQGIAPESDVAVISILGYEASKYYTGRGPLESYAVGLEVKDGDLAYRVNFATKESSSRKIIDRRVGRNLSYEEASLLSKEINEKVELKNARFYFKNTIGHRGVLVIRSNEGKLSGEVTNTDPAYEKKGPYGVAKPSFEMVVQIAEPVKGFKDSHQAQEASRLTNEFVEKSSEVLEGAEVNKKRRKSGKLPANLILTRDGGDRLPKFPKIDKQFNLKMGCFVEMPVERGIALLTGMQVVELPAPTNDLGKDYTIRAGKVVEAMDSYDALYIHIKGPDEPAHDGDYLKKKEIIEQIDNYFFGNLLPKINLRDVIIAVTADHSTPCAMKAHSGDPVPLMICGTGFTYDGLSSFSEKESSKGSLGTLQGHKLMKIFMGFLS